MQEYRKRNGDGKSNFENFVPNWKIEDGEFMVRRIIQRYLEGRDKNMTMEEVTIKMFNVSFCYL